MKAGRDPRHILFVRQPIAPYLMPAGAPGSETGTKPSAELSHPYSLPLSLSFIAAARCCRCCQQFNRHRRFPKIPREHDMVRGRFRVVNEGARCPSLP